MTIHGFRLPTLLARHLESGGRMLSDEESDRLKSLLARLESPRPRLWGPDQIASQHQFWTSPAARCYIGTESAEFAPGRVDPSRVLIIGEADEDSPIALDYRDDGPSVIYLGSVGPQSFWIELAPSYEKLFGALGEPRAID